MIEYTTSDPTRESVSQVVAPVPECLVPILPPAYTTDNNSAAVGCLGLFPAVTTPLERRTVVRCDQLRYQPDTWELFGDFKSAHIVV